MSGLTLIVGNKNYSSWSLRGYLALAACEVPFEEIVVPLDQPETKRQILAHSPTGRVPALRDGEIVVWDSLAIGEYLAERFPNAGLWPQAASARALARAMVAEMHSGFASLRANLPMDLRSRYPGRGHDAPGVREDVDRVLSSWRACRERFGGGGGPFLFGAFSLADAFYAPVATRFRTYGVSLDSVCEAYVESVYAHPPFVKWFEEAKTEPWTIKF